MGNSAMDLETFVQETLTQIVRGVEQARSDIEDMDTNAIISPTRQRWPPGAPPPKTFVQGRGFVQDVTFDVALTVVARGSAEVSGKGGARLKVVGALVDVGADAEGSYTRGHEKSEISRVTFSIPMLLPSTPYDRDAEVEEMLRDILSRLKRTGSGG